ncbi:MAG TPA: sporulation protein YunB [Firmicutes bacterium]|jgi:sporulation protein YunB|nr:sporulation protein YunB [Bacillota bacterium]HAW70925.1 sporulation protein YunB [Bacillota bacterium]HAZ21145.1 sporulation protein YunB [Bacillota bacterium]HBE07082.1 sporulation protein YunB [Bacillota bacterium]HBL49827.1 sporulation protein YunB [Bacillota bacterium]
MLMGRFRFSGRLANRSRSWARSRIPGRGISKGALFIVIVIIAAILTLVIVDRRLRPTLLQIAEMRAQVIATRAINQAISDKIAGGIRYDDLFSIKTDSRGKIVMLQQNTAEVNRLASQATIAVQETLRQISHERIDIPLGQILGSQLLASYGPMITVMVVPLGAVSTRVIDRFEHEGINQTRHRIYLEITGQIRIVVPLISSNVKVVAEVPITDATVLGEVPQVYLNADQKNSQP